jgi:hypothetical protein
MRPFLSVGTATPTALCGFELHAVRARRDTTHQLGGIKPCEWPRGVSFLRSGSLGPRFSVARRVRDSIPSLVTSNTACSRRFSHPQAGSSLCAASPSMHGAVSSARRIWQRTVVKSDALTLTRPRRWETSRRNTLLVTRAGVDPLVPLGYDFLTFLAATVLVVPLFKRAKVSPVLGYLFVGVVLNQLG